MTRLVHHVKRAAAVAASGALVFAVAGCSGASGDDSERTLTYWSMWSEGEPQQKVLAAAIEDFEKETGIQVDVQWQGRDNIKKIVPTLSTGNVPDLIDASWSNLYSTLVATDQALGLGQAYETEVDGAPASDVIPAAYLDQVDVELPDGQPWMLPYQITSDAIWYNAAKHPEISENPPRTWDEFTAALDGLKAAGETPLAADGDIPGYNVYYLNTLLIRNGGPGFLKSLAQDETGEAWNDPKVLDAAKKVRELVDGGYFIKGYDASKFPAQQQKWANDEAALMMMGSWMPVETAPYAADGFEYATLPFPSTGEDQSMRVDFTGFAVPKKADHADEAQQFAAFFLGKEYQDSWGVDAKALPIRADVETAPELVGLQEAITQASGHYQQNDGIAFPGYNETVYWPLNDQLFLGKISPEEFVSQIKEKQAAYWKENSQ